MEKIRRYHQIRGGARSPNDEISPPGRVWDRELTENRWIHLLRLGSPKHRRENSIARTARLERNRYPLVESHSIRNLRLCPFGSLAKNPLANIGWAVNQYDAPVLALTQESNNLNVHKSDLIQVHEYANAVIVHLSLYVADIGRLNSTTEPQGCSVSVRLLFNPQHWQLPLYQLVIGCWIRKSAFLRYPGVHDECHLQAIEEKLGILILDDAFSTNGENSINCLARPTRELAADSCTWPKRSENR